MGEKTFLIKKILLKFLRLQISSIKFKKTIKQTIKIKNMIEMLQAPVLIRHINKL